jgi:vacuolar iron transporter family protein
MEIPLRKGVGFGLTSGVITTLGLIIGLYSGIGSRNVVIAGILTIAIADSLSDALGIHVSEEASGKNSHRDIWIATFATFFSKIIIALSFLIPVLLFELKLAIIYSLIWGLVLIVLFSYYIARVKNEKAFGIIFEHLVIAIIVVIATYFVGLGIGNVFG